MAWGTKESKASAAGEHAARARTEGREVFVFNAAMPGAGLRRNEPVAGLAEAIEAIEREGWGLSSWVYGQDVLLLMFRRSAAHV